MVDAGTAHPLVGVVVVNYRAMDLTLRCVDSLVNCLWPSDRLRVMVVDNGDDGDLASAVTERFPPVRYRFSGGNVGFAEACNIGMRELAAVDHLALVNNDATVHPAWLEPLVRALDDDPHLGAAVPKILFAPQFVAVEAEEGGRVTALTVDGRDVLARVQPGPGAVRRPDPGELGRHVLDVEIGAQLLLPVVDGDAASWSVALTTVTTGAPTPRCTTIRCEGPSLAVINNFGTVLHPDGSGADRCFRRIDDGSCDEVTDVFSFSGGGVLFRRAFLDDVGLFDPRFFTYYEDLDLGWRGARRGWRYRTVPESTLRHIHTATTVEGSASFVFHNERNRLLTMARNGSAGPMARTAVGHVRATLGLVRHELLGGRAEAGTAARQRLKVRCLAFLSFLALLPGTLATRVPRAGRRIGASPIGQRSQPFRGSVMAMDGRSAS